MYFICYYDYSVVYWFFATSCLIIRMFLVTRCVVLSKFLWQSHVFTKYINSEYCRSNDARKKKTFFIYKKHLSFSINLSVLLQNIPQRFSTSSFLRIEYTVENSKLVWLLIGLNLYERMWIIQKLSHFWAPSCKFGPWWKVCSV